MTSGMANMPMTLGVASRNRVDTTGAFSICCVRVARSPVGVAGTVGVIVLMARASWRGPAVR